MSKQDRISPRKPSDLVQMYGFEKQFNETFEKVNRIEVTLRTEVSAAVEAARNAEAAAENANTSLQSKVDKEDGKGLSANDYTTEEKTKLAGIAEGANLYVHPTASSAGAMGLYKVAIDGTGHISEKAAVTKEDITPLLDIEAILSGLPDAMEEDY